MQGTTVPNLREIAQTSRADATTPQPLLYENNTTTNASSTNSGTQAQISKVVFQHTILWLSPIFQKKMITSLERGFLEDPYSRGPDSWKIWNAKS
jgi:hypothetical protein